MGHPKDVFLGDRSTCLLYPCGGWRGKTASGHHSQVKASELRLANTVFHSGQRTNFGFCNSSFSQPLLLSLAYIQRNDRRTPPCTLVSPELFTGPLIAVAIPPPLDVDPYQIRILNDCAAGVRARAAVFVG